MPLIQQILLVIRTLTEDEPPQYYRNYHERKSRQRSNSKRQQAVNLVITFRELFASGGLNFLLDDDAGNRSTNERNKHRRGSIRNTPNHVTSELEDSEQCLVDLTDHNAESKVAILHEPRNNVSGRHLCEIVGNQNICEKEYSKQCLVDLTDETDLLKPVNRMATSTEPAMPVRGSNRSSTNAIIKELEVFGRSSKRRSRRQPVTVSLPSEDENKTVAALRKVLKWSPTKQNLATFAVSVPNRDDEHKAVAVVQNAVNRVKEEQQKKKKRKWKMFRLTFC